MKQASECKFVKIGKGSTGNARFTSAEEVATAIATLNVSTFQGTVKYGKQIDLTDVGMIRLYD